jgi:hypothetical protein
VGCSVLPGEQRIRAVTGSVFPTDRGCMAFKANVDPLAVAAPERPQGV